MKENIQQRDKIVKDEDFDALFSLSSNPDFSIGLHQILVKRYDNDPASLNPIQLNLFLCMHLENAGQADSIIAFLQEWFPEHNERVIESLKEIGAILSAEIIREAVALLPEDGSWFFKSCSEEAEKQMVKLDSKFSDYPDGPMRDLYRKYAELHRDQFK